MAVDPLSDRPAAQDSEVQQVGNNPFWDSDMGLFYYAVVYWCPSSDGGASVNDSIIKQPCVRIPRGIRLGRVMVIMYPYQYICMYSTKMYQLLVKTYPLFSSPEPKARVSYCHSAPFVLRPAGVNFKFSHFRLLLWNRWTEFNKTWQEARAQRPLPSLCFSGRSEKQDGRPGLWLAESFSTSLKPLNRIQWNLTGSRISTSSTKFVFYRADRKNKMAALASDCLRHFRLLLWNRWMEFNENLAGSKISTSSTKFVFLGPIGKTRWPPWLLICWDFFDLVAHCTQVHNMWPFGPLVHNSTETVWEWEHFIEYPMKKSGNSNASKIAM